MKRTAERRAGWRAEAVPAEVDLSGLSVERARLALGRLREAVVARKAGGHEAPDFRGRSHAAEQCGLNGGALEAERGGREMWWNQYKRPAGRGRADLRTTSQA
jgi:hypothetical protein